MRARYLCALMLAAIGPVPPLGEILRAEDADGGKGVVNTALEEGSTTAFWDVDSSLMFVGCPVLPPECVCDGLEGCILSVSGEYLLQGGINNATACDTPAFISVSVFDFVQSGEFLTVFGPNVAMTGCIGLDGPTASFCVEGDSVISGCVSTWSLSGEFAAPPRNQWTGCLNVVFADSPECMGCQNSVSTPPLTANRPMPDCNENGLDDECDLDCGVAGGACDVEGCGASDDCNNNCVPDDCENFEPSLSVVWVGGESGLWSDPKNWCPAVVPNNNGQTFDVFISTGAVTLDLSPTLDTLWVADDGSLGVDAAGGDRVLTILHGLTNESTIRALDGRTLTLLGDLEQEGVKGTGVIRSVGAGSLVKIGTEFSAATVLGGVLEVTGQDARIVLDNSTAFAVALSTIDDGVIQVVNDGTLVDPTIQILEVPDGERGFVEGAVHVESSGEILINAQTEPTALQPTDVAQEVRLEGAGTLRLSEDPSNPNARAILGDAFVPLCTGSEFHITGIGRIDATAIFNEGTITAEPVAGSDRALNLLAFDVANLGEIVVQPGASLFVLGDVTTFGNASMAVAGQAEAAAFAVTGTCPASFALGCTPPIMSVSLDGAVTGDAMAASGNADLPGIIQVSGAAVIDLSDSLTLDAGGVYRPDPEREVSTDALLRASVITLKTAAGNTGAQMILDDAMRVETAASLESADAFVIDGYCPGSQLVGCTPPILDMFGDAQVDGSTMNALNGGVIQMADAASITLTGALSLDSAAAYQANPNTVTTNTASLSAGSISITTDAIGGGARMMLADQMTVETSGAFALNGTCSGGQAVTGCTPPVLFLPDMAQMAVGGDFVIIETAEVTVGGSSESSAVGTGLSVQVGGNFDNRSTAASIFDWTAGPLTLNGGKQTFEAAGVEMGPTLDGLVNNFAMGTLEIAGGSSVAIVDTFDNAGNGSDDCTEALYVYTVILRTGANVTLTNANVYYVHLDNEGVTPLETGCGKLAQIPTGDGDGDGDVDLFDFEVFQDCLKGPFVPDCAAFDFDFDGDVDLTDFGGLQIVFSNP